MPTNDGSFADIILAAIIGKRQTLIAMGAAAVAAAVAVVTRVCSARLTPRDVRASTISY